MNQTFEEWLINYIATQRKSNYENHNQVSCALEYVLDIYRKKEKENGRSKSMQLLQKDNK